MQKVEIGQIWRFGSIDYLILKINKGSNYIPFCADIIRVSNDDTCIKYVAENSMHLNDNLFPKYPKRWTYLKTSHKFCKKCKI